MHHAIGAFGVAALVAVVLPHRVVHEFAERIGVALLQEVTGLLPTEQVVTRHAPRSAFVVALAHEELEEERRLVEDPLAFARGAIGQDHLEELIGFAALEEAALIGRFVVSVAGRKHHALDAEFHHLVKERAHRVGIRALEERGVGGHTESHFHGQANSCDGLLVGAFATHCEIVMFFLPIHVHAKRQVLRRLEQPRFQLFFEQQRVSTEVDVLLARDEPLDNFLDLRMEQRLAAWNRNHRRAAFFRRIKALLRSEMTLENVRGILNLATARAGEIAAKERLQHEHQRVALAPAQLLCQHIASDGPHLTERNSHAYLGGHVTGEARKSRRASEATILRKFADSIEPPSDHAVARTWFVQVSIRSLRRYSCARGM